MKRFLAVFIFLAASPVLAQQILFVQVVNQTGGPIAGATVTILETDGPQIGTATTDAEGRAEVTGVNPSRQYSARVTALNYVPFAGPLSYPDSGRRVDNPVTIALQRARPALRPPPPPDPPARADQTITMDQAFFDRTSAAGWAHEAIGSSWLRRCQLFPRGTQAMPTGWVLRGGSHLWAFFTSASCTFRLFGDRELNAPWTFVSYTFVDGRDSGLCPPEYMVNVLTTPPTGNTAIPLVVHLTAGWSDCHAAVTEVIVNGPEGADPTEAFVP
jgi:hypothetical protein